MARVRDQDQEDEGEEKARNLKRSPKLSELGLACMLNTEVGAVLAVIRRTPDPTSQFLPPPEENIDPALLNSLKSLRALIFNPQQEWHNIDPLFYLSPFLEVIESDNIPATATGVALSAILKILKLEIFDEKTPGAGSAIQSVANGITNCHLEATDPMSEDAVMMRILQAGSAILVDETIAFILSQFLLSRYFVFNLGAVCFMQFNF